MLSYLQVVFTKRFYCNKCALQGENKYCILAGGDEHGWALNYKGTTWHDGHYTEYCSPFYDANTVIGVHLDLNKGTLSFYKNGADLGVAFYGLNHVKSALYPVVSSSLPGAEFGLGKRLSCYPSLQGQCYRTIANNITNISDAELLPLPRILKWHLCKLK